MLQARTLVGVAGTALVLGVVAWFTMFKSTPHGSIEISSVDNKWSVEVSEVR